VEEVGVAHFRGAVLDGRFYALARRDWQVLANLGEPGYLSVAIVAAPRCDSCGQTAACTAGVRDTSSDLAFAIGEFFLIGPLPEVTGMSPAGIQQP
jgi:hypothetical protein